MMRKPCNMPTASLRFCKRPARYEWRDGGTEEYNGRDGTAVYRACSQHADTRSGRNRMLLPRPWEFSCVVDLASGVTVTSRMGGN